MTHRFKHQGETPTIGPQVVLAGQMQEAMRFLNTGRLGEAQLLYEAVVRHHPNNTDARHLLAIVRYRQGHADDALRLIRQASRGDPRNAIILLNLARILRHVGLVDEASSTFKKATKANPKNIAAYVDWSRMLCDIGRFKEALLPIETALAIDGNHADSLNLCGNALRGLGYSAAALECFGRAVSASPTSAGPYYNQGLVLTDLGRFEEAIASFDAALAIQPTYALAHNNRGLALASLCRHAEALESYERAFAIDPTCLLALNNRGNTLRDLNRDEDALACYEQVLARDPSMAAVHNNRGNLLNDLGRFTEAQSAFEEAIALDPACGSYYLNLSIVRPFAADDPVIQAMEDLLTDAGREAGDNRAWLGYALGKAYSDCGNHERAFQHYLSGAKARRSTIEYDEEATMRLFDRIESVFSASFMASKAGLGDPSARPIFILGMPRSGTSLVEQVLASHPSVFGAGELSAASSAIRRSEVAFGAHPDCRFPEIVPMLDASGFRRLAADYLQSIAVLSDNRDRVTDKMPSNFFLLGLIHLMLPNAKIIHTIRNPIDTCISCFTTFFADPQNFSYELGELGRYYRRYEKMMSHWRTVLPKGTFIDVHYEHMVADLEMEARRLLAHCDLSWDDTCLSFYKTKRAVRTASLNQVRQPIYSKAVGRWRVYEQHLEPLLAELDLGSDYINA